MPGTVSITSAELYFEVNEDSQEFQKADPTVLRYIVQNNLVHSTQHTVQMFVEKNSFIFLTF